MAIFGDTVPRDLYERVLDELSAERERYAGLVNQIVDFKRHEVGLHPNGFDPNASNPMSQLGPKTEMAIEEFAGGATDLRQYLIGQAINKTAAEKLNPDVEDVDGQVAAWILAGEAG